MTMMDLYMCGQQPSFSLFYNFDPGNDSDIDSTPPTPPLCAEYIHSHTMYYWTHRDTCTCTHNSPCLRKGYRLMPVAWSMMSLLHAVYVNLLCTLTLVMFLASPTNCSPSGLIRSHCFCKLPTDMKTPQ